MKKSIYSLMLFDEIVEAVDRLSYAKGTNRSALINDILARELGLVTPEQKVKIVINRLKDSSSEYLSVKQINENNSIAFGTCIKYKYSPKVKYSYEFTTGEKGKYAVLKVSSRTTSEELCKHFENFYKILGEIDNKLSRGNSDEEIVFNQGNNKMVKTFKDKSFNRYTEEEVAAYLVNYMNMVNTSMGYYFFNIFDQNIFEELERIYKNYLND